MISWLLVIIVAYMFFGLASLGDKLVLAGKPKPASYTFYTGILGIFIVVCIPFIPFGFPDAKSLFWIILDSLVHLAGLYTMFSALVTFDVSKVIATIGATQPIFIFALTWIFWGPQVMTAVNIIAFVILLLGSITISIERNISVTGNYLKIVLVSSLLFALDYIFSKIIFLHQPFLQGIIWIRISALVLVLLFLFKRESRKEIFSKHIIADRKTQVTFLLTQCCGGTANFLQSFAISLAPIAFLATVNSLRGIQYVFLFLMTIFLSSFSPGILKEEISKRIITQKIISIILITIGLLVIVAY